MYVKKIVVILKFKINEDYIVYNRDVSNLILFFKICFFVIFYRSIWIYVIFGMYCFEVVNYLFILFY